VDNYGTARGQRASDRWTPPVPVSAVHTHPVTLCTLVPPAVHSRISAL